MEKSTIDLSSAMQDTVEQAIRWAVDKAVGASDAQTPAVQTAIDTARKRVAESWPTGTIRTRINMASNTKGWTYETTVEAEFPATMSAEDRQRHVDMMGHYVDDLDFEAERRRGVNMARDGFTAKAAD